MQILQLIIDGQNFNSIESFYEEINRLFMEGEDWRLGASLDAFNDMLYGGYGILKDYDQLEMIWEHSDKSKADLGLEKTLAFYADKLKNPAVFNKDFVQSKIDDLNNGIGQTYFEILLEIIAEHANVSLILKP